MRVSRGYPECWPEALSKSHTSYNFKTESYVNVVTVSAKFFFNAMSPGTPSVVQVVAIQ